MNLQNFRYVLEIIEQGSISAAARKLYISQPYLSKILMEVEKEYGISIFSREKNSLILTERGASFSLTIREILDTMHSFEQTLHQLQDVDHLSFSSCPTAFTAEAYLNFIRSCGDTRLRVNYRESDNNTVINDVYTRTSEFGIVILRNWEFQPTEVLLKSMHLTCEWLADLEFYIITRVGHPLSRLLEPIQLEDLYKYDLVLYPQHRSRENYVAETAQYEYNFDCIEWDRIKHITYVQSRAQYYDLIRRTDTVSFGFKPFKNQELTHNIVSLRVAPEFTASLGRDTNSAIYCICPEEHTMSPLASALLEHLRALCE